MQASASCIEDDGLSAYAQKDGGSGMLRIASDATEELCLEPPVKKKKPSPPPPKDVEFFVQDPTKVEYAFTCQGRIQCEALLRAEKNIENRPKILNRFPMGKGGWIALHCGKRRKGNAAVVDDYDKRVLARWGWRGENDERPFTEPPVEGDPAFDSSIVGLLHFTGEAPTLQDPEEKSTKFGNNPWATGKICHYVDKGIRFKQPIQHRGMLGVWKVGGKDPQQPDGQPLSAESLSQRQQLREQIALSLVEQQSLSQNQA